MPTNATCIVFSLILGTLGASATAKEPQQARNVRFVGPVERVAATSLTELSSSLEQLAAIDARNPPSGGDTGQTLSLFGREDLIAATSTYYKPNGCAPSKTTSHVLAEIERRARQTSIVIVTESHERSEHRGFSTALATRLRPLGYDTLALEALSPSMPDTPTQFSRRSSDTWR